MIVSYVRHRPLALHEALHAVSAPIHRDVWILLFSALLIIVVLFAASHVRRGLILAILFRPFIEWAFEKPSIDTTENEVNRRRWFFSALRISYFMLTSVALLSDFSQFAVARGTEGILQYQWDLQHADKNASWLLVNNFDQAYESLE